MPQLQTAEPSGTPAAIIARGPETATKREYDLNGWYEVKDNPISRVGVFPYSGRMIGLEDPELHNQMFMVYRSEEELSDPECIESFKLLPWIDDHVMLGPAMQEVSGQAMAAEEKGIQGVIGQEVYYSDGVLYGNIKVLSNSQASKIAGGKVELSAGYQCKYAQVSGVYEGQPYQFIQCKIRGNHLASVDEGRMGPDVAVLDSAFTITFDFREFQTMKKKFKVSAVRKVLLGLGMDGATKAVATIDADEEATKTGEMSIEALTEILKANMPRITELMSLMAAPAAAEVVEDDDEEGEVAGAAAVVPAASGKPVEDGDDDAAPPTPPAKDEAVPAVAATKDADEEKDKKTEAAMDSLRSQIKVMQTAQDNAERHALARLAQRDGLVARLIPVIGAFDHSAMTLDDVRVYALGKVGVAAPKGHEATALDAFLAARAGAGMDGSVRVGLDAFGADPVASSGTPFFDSLAAKA